MDCDNAENCLKCVGAPSLPYSNNVTAPPPFAPKLWQWQVRLPPLSQLSEESVITWRKRASAMSYRRGAVSRFRAAPQ